MNKLALSLVTLAGAAMFAACSSDEPVTPATGGEGNVTFTVKMPGAPAGRSYGDGYSATNLQYAVYEHGTTTPILTVLDGDANQVTFGATSLETTVSLNLVNGKNYDIIFWADSPDGPYTFNAAAQTITANYDGVNVNAESNDAFYKLETTGVINGPITRTVELTRPFAQVNLGTDDLDVAEAVRVYGDNGSKLTSDITALIPNTLDLTSGAVSGEAEVTFAAAAIPAATETFPVAGYDYLQMDYILTTQSSAVIDLKYNFYADGAKVHTLDVTNVPVQANFRTNIYGSLLTNPAELNVVKVPGWDVPDNNVPYTYATTAAELVANLDGGNVVVPPGVNITLDPTDRLVITKPTSLVVEGTLTTTPDITSRAGDVDYSALIEVKSELEISGTGTIHADASLPGAIQVASTGKLTAKDVTINFDRTYHFYAGEADWGIGATLLIDGGDVTLDNVTLTSGIYTIRALPNREGRGAGTLNATNCVIKSSSNNQNKDPEGNSNWAYAMRIAGVTGTLTNCTVIGIQGGISVEDDADLTIDGGTYATFNIKGSATGWSAFWPVYLTGEGNVTINSGYFYAANAAGLNKNLLLGGNNDVHDGPWGNMTVNGGYFSGKPYLSGDDKQGIPEKFPAADKLVEVNPAVTQDLITADGVAAVATYYYEVK